MKDRIDPLIAERAPWLFQNGPMATTARAMLDKVLSYDETVSLAQDLKHTPTLPLMAQMYERLARHVTARGLDNVPRQGPALVVANHPTGIADGIILHGLLARTRPDTYFFANRDILRIMPQMSDLIAPVEWRKEKRWN